MNFFYFSVILGPILFLVGMIVLIKRIIFLKNAKTVLGTVMEMKKGYIDNRRTYFPVVKYTDFAGHTKVFESDTGYSSQLKYKVGDTIKCKYRLSKGIDEIHILSFFSLFGISLLFISIGALFSVIGYYGSINLK